MSRNHKPRRPVERFIRRKQLAKGSSGSQSAGAGAAASGGDLGSVLSEENVEDYVAHLIANTTEISFTYNDVGNSLTADINPDSVVVGRLHITTTDKLVGRDSASSGPGEEIGLGVSLEFDGVGNIQRAALTGDVTASSGSNSTTIANDAVTFAKMQNITDGVLLGAEGGTEIEEITVGSGLTLSSNTLSLSTAVITDHGGLTGLSDDDHPQYVLADGTRALSGNWDAGAVTIEVDNSIAGDPGVEGTGITIRTTTYNSSLKVSSLGSSNLGDFILHRHATDRGAAIIASRAHTSDSTHSIVLDNDELFTLFAVGYDGTDYEEAARISIAVDGTPGSDDVPGRIQFYTSTGGSSVERLQITSDGEWGFAGANYGTAGQAIVSNGSGSAPTWQNIDSVNVDYDNSTSGLTATEIQSAIDEVEGRVDTLESGGSGLTQPQVLARISMRV